MSKTTTTMTKNNFWQFRAAKGDPKVGELLLYGDISGTSWLGDEVTPKKFKDDMNALGEVDEINVYINSPGGDVFAGQAIHSMLKRHEAKINVYVDGIAASAASVVAMAGDTNYIPKNAMMMIHNAKTFMYGDANAFRKKAESLDQACEAMISAYEGKTGMDREKIKKMMDDETWMTAEECVEMGFADELEEEKAIAASLNGNILVVNGQEVDLSRFKNPPKLAFLPAQGGPPPERPALAPPEQPAAVEPSPPELSPEDKQAASGRLSLFAAQVQLNKNRARR